MTIFYVILTHFSAVTEFCNSSAVGWGEAGPGVIVGGTDRRIVDRQSMGGGGGNNK